MPLSDFISNEEQLKLHLRKGLVVKIRGDTPFPSTHYHHFVVLNYEPNTETVLILTHGTHQVEDELLKADSQNEDVLKTVVYISPGTYNFFRRPTVFNCNEPKEVPFQKLVEAMDSGNLSIPPSDTLMVEDIQRLVDGVMASGQVTKIIKDLLIENTDHE